MTARFPAHFWFWVAPLGVILAGVLATLALRLGWAYPCPFKLLFEMPCLTCGGTRAFAALAALDPVGAIRYNPLLVLATFAVLSGLILKERFFRWVAAVPMPFWVALALANWIYLILFLPR